MSMEDVKLCCRRNQSLLDFIQKQADKIKANKATESEGAGTEGKTKGKGGRKKRTISIEDD